MTVSDEIESRILDKAEHIGTAVTVLSEKQALDRQSYQSDREQRAVVEREFQTAIEGCIDIAGLLLRALDAPMPETYAGRFRSLNEHGVLSDETGKHMHEAAGFRNILVHRYGDELDDDIVYQHLQTELSWIVRFLGEVREFLDNPDQQ